MRSAQTRCEEDCPPPEETECKICYQHYNAYKRKPKILDCLHRVCTQCLLQILDVAEGAGFILCPFCRHQTPITDSEVSALPDDANIMSHLALQERSWSSDHTGEVLLTPKSSPSPDSSSCLVVTVTEEQRGSERSPRQNSVASAEQSLESASAGSDGHAAQRATSNFCRHVPRMLVWLLGFLYFGSLPLGIYLLVLQKVTLGIVSVSLVPTSLTVCLLYEFCSVCVRTCVAAPDS
uniref:E3 ubiquitin-protein ligase RNF182 n=1 Tax=Tetraodon nigroviridis TaxID=99883 RepID=H3C5G6_TETNG